jgi:hydroxycarboxylate dehydrogenase B
MNISPTVLTPFVAGLFRAGGSSEAEAKVVAEHLVDADLSGHESHGVARVPRYLQSVTDGFVVPNAQPVCSHDRGSIAAVDGMLSYGQVGAHFSTALGIERARTHGIAAVSLTRTGHVGRAGAWAEQAAAAGIASIHFVCAPRPGGAQLAPFGGADRRMGTNPIAMGMPVAGRDPVILDFATAAVAAGRVRLAAARGAKVPEKVIVDAEGNLTDEGRAFVGPPEGSILPFGGHKGYGLNLMGELFGAALAGIPIRYAGEERNTHAPNNILQIFFTPDAFGHADSIAGNVSGFFEWIKEAPKQKGVDEILVPGELEARRKRKQVAEGIALNDGTWTTLVKTAAGLGVAVPAL